MSPLTFSLWLVGFVLSCSLLVLLIQRRRVQIEPCFASWVAFTVGNAVVLGIIYRLHKPRLYAGCYWTMAILDLSLQLAVMFEIAKKVLTRRSGWVSAAASNFRNSTILSIVIATSVALALHPAAQSSSDSLFARCNLFMTVLLCFMFLAIVKTSKRFGLAWSERVQKTGYGFMCWTLASFVTDTLHYYWPAANYFSGLECIRSISFQLATAYWIYITVKANDTPAEDSKVADRTCALNSTEVSLDSFRIPEQARGAY